MKNREAEFYLFQFRALESGYFGLNKANGVELPFDPEKLILSQRFVYFMKANIRVLSKVKKEREAIIEDFKEVFKKTHKLDDKKLADKSIAKKADEDFKKFMAEEEQVERFKRFDEEEFKEDIYKLTDSEKELYSEGAKTVIPTDFEIILSPFFDLEDETEELEDEKTDKEAE